MLHWYEKLICKLLIRQTMKDPALQEKSVNVYAGAHQIARPVTLTNSIELGTSFESSDQILPNSQISRKDLATDIVNGTFSKKTGPYCICARN